MRLLFATGNRGKVREVQELLGSSVIVESMLDHPSISLPEETGSTFAENAAIKALHAARALNVPALADDSGLMVDALNGAPGLHSARYAAGSDGDRITKLLSALENVPDDRRRARFVCALAFVRPGSEPLITEGRVEGRIVRAPRGEGGFGYDPIFELLPEELALIGAGGAVGGAAKTMAELTSSEKGALSHRARALALMRPALARHFSLVESPPKK